METRPTLRPGEVVHHINGDPRDNHPDNLQILPSQRAHMLLHHYERRVHDGVQHLLLLDTLLTALGERGLRHSTTLNGRPRETLGWKSPGEAYAETVAMTD